MTIDRSRQIDQLRQWSRLMDEAYRVPGTTFRFGWDPIIGLIPGAGDLATSSLSVMVLFRAVRLGVPRVVIARMLLNILIDLLAGTVPIVGDLFDFAWKSNSMNLALLERHERPGVKPSSGDWAVVLLAAVLICGVLALVLTSVVLMGRVIMRPFL
jgi:hypothetical protein